jgi:hypothetical protein
MPPSGQLKNQNRRLRIHVDTAGANMAAVCYSDHAPFMGTRREAGRVAEWFKAPVLKFDYAHPSLFVLIPPSLISFTKFNFPFHPLPSSPSPLPNVRDHFGDHFIFVLRMFGRGPMLMRKIP